MQSACTVAAVVSGESNTTITSAVQSAGQCVPRGGRELMPMAYVGDVSNLAHSPPKVGHLCDFAPPALTVIGSKRRLRGPIMSLGPLT